MESKSLKNYQEKALERLISRTRDLFCDGQIQRTIVFQSPTGSGKTFIIAKYIEEIIKELEDRDLCFVWISIGKGELHKQSYEALKNSFNGFPPVYLLEEEFFGSRNEIEKNEVVVVNWEKLRTKKRKSGDWKNLLMKDKETTNFRELVQNTKEAGKTVVMVIDESHSNATSERAKELRDEVVAPDITIEMSATPVLTDGDFEKVTVQPNDVIEEGMIKKEIIINENIDKIDDDELNSQELVLEAAFEKHKELARIYKNKGIVINPLVLIQLPSSDAGEDKKDFIEGFLAKKGVTYHGRKLAVWLTDEKVNNEKSIVVPNDSHVDFLIFKQALDTGWDCPRAQILVMFREIKEVKFKIQTVGRILRMPEACHYPEDELNRGYVYTNLKSIEVERETYNPNIIKSVHVKRSPDYKPTKLSSYYRQRTSYGDITASYYGVLESILCGVFGINIDRFEFGSFVKNKKLVSKVIDTKHLEDTDEIILNKEINSVLFDKISDEKIKADELLSAHLSQNDLFHLFENIIKINLNGFAPKRSLPTVKAALYGWFKKYLGTDLGNNGMIYIQSIVLNNPDFFSQVFDTSIVEYKPIKDKEDQKKAEEKEQWDENWEISPNRNFNPNTYKRFDYSGCLYKPCYLRIDSTEETKFIESFLEKKSDRLDWWWQNGDEHMQLNFGIKYGADKTFQPDFLVKLKDGRLGIFDTKKSGDREDDNKKKSEALYTYLLEENKKGKNFFGGIVLKEGQHYKVNYKQIYRPYGEHPEDWDYLTI